jgi:hypothetical protein
MPFIYIDELGFERFISSASLKRKLTTLSSENEYDAVPESTQTSSQTGDLKIFFDKIGVSNIERVYYEDIYETISDLVNSSNENIEYIKTLFSLERIHFLAIVYLLTYNFISIRDIKEMIEMPFYTRSEYLLKMLDKELIENITGQDILGTFNSFLRELGREQRIKEEAIPRSTKMNVPNVAIAINDSQLYYFIDSINNDSAGRNFRVYPFSLFSRTLSVERKLWLFNETLNETKREYKILQDLKEITQPKHSFFLQNIYDFLLNNEFPKSISKTISNFPSNILTKMSNTFSVQSQDIITSIRQSVNYEFSNIGNKPQIYSYFDFLYFAHGNLGNYLSTNSIIPPASPFSNPSIYNLNYIQVPRLKNLVQEIFYETTTEKRQDLSYFRKFFIGRNTLSKTESAKSLFSNLDSTKLGYLKNLANIDFIIRESDSTVTSIGSNRLDFMSLIREILIEKADEIGEIDLDNTLLTWNQVQIYLQNYKNIVTTSLREKVLPDAEDDLFRYLYIDLFENYIDYLKDPARTTVSRNVRDETKQIYRTANFISQTFSNIKKFYNALVNTKEMDLVYLLFYFYFNSAGINSSLDKSFVESRISYVYRYTLNDNSKKQIITDITL